jgi:hypothetical protein
LAVFVHQGVCGLSRHLHFEITAKRHDCAPVFLALFYLGKTPQKTAQKKTKKPPQKDFHAEIFLVLFILFVNKINSERINPDQHND